MHIQHQQGIPTIIPKDPINDHKTYKVKGSKTITILLFLSWSATSTKKLTSASKYLPTHACI